MRRDLKIISKGYTSFIRDKPCLGCGSIDTEGHHYLATGQRKSKQNDFTQLPLCRKCHSEIHQIGPSKWASKAGINIYEELFWLLVEAVTTRGMYDKAEGKNGQ